MIGYEKGRRGLVAGLALWCLGAAGACGNVTSGGFGDAEVVMSSGEVEDPQGTAASAHLADGEGPLPTSHLSGLSGTMTVRVRTYARSGAGDFVELTDGIQELTLPLDDPEPVGIASRSLPAGRYNAVRTVFEKVEADVLGGLVVGELPITGTVRVDLGDAGSLGVVTETGFDVAEGVATMIVLEMRSAAWLPLAEADGTLWLVDAADFRSAFRVQIGPSMP